MTNPQLPRKRDADVFSVTRFIQRAARDGEQVTPEKMASLVANLVAAVVVTDSSLPDDPIIYVNPAFTKLTGYSAEDVQGRNCRLLQGRDTDPGALERIRAGIMRPQSVTVDVLNYRNDGNPFWNQLSISPILDKDGHARYFAGFLKEVGTPRALREQLSIRDAQFRAFLDRAGIGLTQTDAKGVIQEVNTVFADMVGYSQQELQGVPLEMIAHPDDISAAVSLLREVAQGIRVTAQMEQRFVHKDGQIIWGKLTFAAIEDPAAFPRNVMTMVENINAVKEQERQLELRSRLLDAVGQAVIATDLDGTIVYWNPSAERTYGWSHADAMGRNILDVTPTRATKEQAAEIFARLAAGAVWHGELMLRRRDGTEFPASVTNAPLFDDNGELEGVSGVSSDISAAWEAEAALHTSNALLNAVLNSTSDSIVVKDLDGRFLLMNEAARALIGIPFDDVSGRDASDFFQPETILEIRERDEAILATGQSQEYEITLHAEHSTKTMFTTKDVFRDADGQIAGVVAIARDVSIRKREEEELRRSEKRFRVIFHHAAIGMVLTEPDGLILQSNPSFQHIVGYSEDELLRLKAVNLTHPEDVSLHLVPLQEMLAGKRERIQLDKRYVHKHGHTVWGRITASLLPGTQTGKPVVISMLEDITEQRRAAEDEMHLLQREREVADRLRELEQWRTDFVRIMGHELRTPLGQIIGFAELLTAEADRLTERGSRHLAHVNAAADRLQILVQRLFDLLTLHAEEVRLDRERVDVRFLVDSVLESVRPGLGPRGISLQVDRSAEPCWVHGDFQRVYQAVAELIDNALNASRTGGVVEVTVQPVKDRIEVEIKDTGEGLSAEVADAVFTGRTMDALTRRSGGAGLGLSMARRIAELHKGHVRLVPSERGACFVLSLQRSS